MKRALIFLFTALTVQLVNAQNVGIGTTLPTEKLQVTGNIKADTLKPNAIKLTPNAGNGKVLTSDVNGNASWQGLTTSGNVGYGVWGDCAANGNISGYQPVDDSSSTAGPYFGQSLSVSGEFAVIGNLSDDVNGNNFQGSATLYRYNGSSWDFFQKITDPTGATGDQFGGSVSISGNFLVCGAHSDDVGSNGAQGSVSVFRFNGSSWVFAQKITDANGGAGDYFGESVSMSGNFMIVGAYFDDNGSILVDRGSVSFYRYNGSSWTFMQKSFDPDGAQDDYFGDGVSISGDYAVVASFGDDDTYTDQGSVTVYKFNGISSFVRLEKIYDNTPAANEEFGKAVSNVGSDIFVGAYQENSYKGKVSWYRYVNNAYQRIQSFLSNSTEIGSISFGYSVSASGNYLLIGSPSRDFDPETNVGELVLYQRVGNYYYKMQSIRDPGATSNSQFGGPVAIDGAAKHFMGSNYINSASSKVVFGKIN